MTRASLRVLGGFELCAPDGAACAPGTRKARALIAYLALTAGQRHPREKLAALLWEESAEAQARASLRQALRMVRRALAPEGGEVFLADRENIGLDPTALDLDAAAFEAKADADDPETLAEAVALYRGELLDGFGVDAPAFDEWLSAERQRLRARALAAMERLLGHESGGERPERAVHVALRLLALDPLREDVHRTLMRLYARQGRFTQALSQYQACREGLEAELGVQPDAETDGLYRDILKRRRREAAQDGPADPARPEPTESPKVPAEPQAAELRQVTVLYAALAGFAELADALEPEDLHAASEGFLGVVEAIVAEHGGSIETRLGGGVMAVFGAPAAHSSDAERAIRAALALHERVAGLETPAGRRLAAQVGIASGEVLVGRVGRQQMTTGRSANLAGRLAEHARPGETRLADPVRVALADRLRVRPAGETRVAGAESPQRIWRLEGLVDRGAGPPDRPFIGREAELARVAALLDACRRDGQGSLVYLRGEAGIGKTRLVEEIVRRAEALGFASETALILDFGARRGQNAIASIAHGLLRGFTDAETNADAAIEAGLVAADRRIFLNELLGHAQPEDLARRYRAMDASTRRRGLHATLVELAAACARRQPLLLVVEDLHWADAGTLDTLQALANGLADAPAILLATARSEDDPLGPAWRAALEAGLLTLDLMPLKRAEAFALAACYADAEAPFTTECVARAEGNPLFLEQLLRSGESRQGAVPGSIQSIVLARLDRLEPADRSALQAASVMGQRFSLPALRFLTGEPGRSCEPFLAEALVRPEDEDYLFTHALVRDAVYASLTKARRRELHRRAAGWFADGEPALRAGHLDRAGDPEAAAAYLDAAREAAERFRHDEALRLAERADVLADDPALTFELASLRGDLLRGVGEVDASLDAFERARGFAGDESQRARAWLGSASAMRILDRYDEALAALDAAERAESRGEASAERFAQIHYLRGNMHFPLGAIDRCLAAHERALAAAREAGSPALEARALGGLGDANYARGRISMAHQQFSQCVSISRSHGFTRVEVINLPMVAATGMYANDFARTLEDCRSAIEAASRIGHLRAELIARTVACFALIEMDDRPALRDQLDHAQGLVRRLRALRFEPENLLYRAKLAHAEGDRAEAMRLLEDARRIAHDTGTGYIGPTVLAAIALFSEDAERRAEALAEGEALLARGVVSHNHLWFYRDAMEAALVNADWDACERYAARLEAYTRPDPLPWSEFHVARARVLAAHARGARDADHAGALRRLLDTARRVGLHAAAPPLEAAAAEIGAGRPAP